MKPTRVLYTAVWLLLAVKLGKFVFYGAFFARRLGKTGEHDAKAAHDCWLSIVKDVTEQVPFFCRRDLQALLLNEITFGRYIRDAFAGKTLAVVRNIWNP